MSGSQTQNQSYNQNQTDNSKFATQASPWSVQAPYIQQAFQDASGAMIQSANAPKPTQFVAPFSPAAYQTYADMLNYGNNNPLPGWETGTGQGVAGAGAGGATGALTALGAFDPSNTNNVSSVLGAASQYANNPAISGMVDAAMRDARQQAEDVTLPGIASNAAATNNTNSNRTAIEQGIVDRGLAQQAGDISANLRGQAFNTGLTTAENQYLTNNAQRLMAMTGAGGLGSGLLGTGLGAVSQGLGDQGNLYGLAATGGNLQEVANQAPNANALQAWEFGTQAPFAPLDQLWNIVGANSWGSQASGTAQDLSNTSGTSTTTTTPSIWQTIGGLMSAAGSLAGGFTGRR